MIFGKNHDKGICLNGVRPEIVTIGENGITEDDLLVHDETASEPTLAYLLSRMQFPEFPVPIGVFRSVEHPTYEALVENQIESAVKRLGTGSLDKLLNSGDTWTID
jgi:2-oxoglutarate ferredoxin oxidoreductase subunit beta